MADTAKKTPKTKTPKVPKVAKPAVKKSKPRNYQLSNGVWRFSKSRMFHKRAKWRSLGKKEPTSAGVVRLRKVKQAKSPRYVEKPIGGEKNGSKRLVRVKKLPKTYPAEKARRPKRHHKAPFYKHKRNLRSSITPGTVLIVVAGRHRGKRVVFLKQLRTGLLLITGPLKINRCPLRRIHQNYVIATKTHLDVSKVEVPKQVNDKYFRRIHENRKKANKAGDNIFKKKKKAYKVSAERKKDQAVVDKQLLGVIRAHPDRKLLIRYLGSLFQLKNKMYPHKMKF